MNTCHQYNSSHQIPVINAARTSARYRRALSRTSVFQLVVRRARRVRVVFLFLLLLSTEATDTPRAQQERLQPHHGVRGPAAGHFEAQAEKTRRQTSHFSTVIPRQQLQGRGWRAFRGSRQGSLSRDQIRIRRLPRSSNTMDTKSLRGRVQVDDPPLPSSRTEREAFAYFDNPISCLCCWYAELRPNRPAPLANQNSPAEQRGGGQDQ